MSSDLSPEDKALLEKLTGRFTRAHDGVHAKFRRKAEHHYALWNNYSDWKGQLPTDRRDRDQGLQSAKRDWGAELFIPYAFSTVETILPRMLSQAPSIIVKPRDRASEENTNNIKATVEAQQEQIDYELILQKIARWGLMIGLGVQKVYWRRDERLKKVVSRRSVQIPGMSEWVVKETRATAFDDPMVECIDPFDFIWDPFGDSIDTCEWMFHRAWRSTDYCLRMLDTGIWTGIDRRDISEGPGGAGKFTETFQKRMSIAGYKDFKADDTHEVWEYHDGTQVVTVLDRQWIVQQGRNPAWHGELPFQVFRPTSIQGQMAGKGEIEPIEDLQSEINTLRSQRRDNATVVLQQSFFYADGMIDPDDFKIGPGKGIPVLGDPREAVMPIKFGEIPGSGYQEERGLQADIERTTGIDDSLSGAGGTQQTATGVQLVQAAANLRIAQKTRNCEIECVRGGGRQFVALSQQRILTNRDIRVPSEPRPGEPDRRWSWLTVGPRELAGEFDIDIEGGSMAPENVPQQRQDAQIVAGLYANPTFGPLLDPAQGLRFVLKNVGVKAPETWLQAQGPQVPMDRVQAIGQMLVKARPDLEGLVGQAMHAVLAQNGNGNGNGNG